LLQNILFRNGILEKALDAAWLRNEVISNNIANVDTPGYKRKTVKFEEFLNNELKNSKISKGQTKLQSPDIVVATDYSTLSYRSDGNNVDIENEMAELAANTLRYNVLVQKMNGDFQNLRRVIRGGV
jgi:flagellar basal-body rod protein FlgB